MSDVAPSRCQAAGELAREPSTRRRARRRALRGAPLRPSRPAAQQLPSLARVVRGFLHRNPLTFENWEQARARPNAQPALLIALVNKFPDMVERLENVWMLEVE